jgi:hypothetical protein
MVLGYDWSRPSNNIVHPIIGSENPAITFRPAGPRRGTLSIFCLTEAEAVATVDLHAKPGSFDYIDTDVSSAAMTYVPVDDIRATLDAGTQKRWIVDVPYQQVAL